MSKCAEDIRKDIEKTVVGLLSKDFDYEAQYSEFRAPEFYWRNKQSVYVKKIRHVNELFKVRLLTPVDVYTRPGTYKLEIPQQLVDAYLEAYTDIKEEVTSAQTDIYEDRDITEWAKKVIPSKTWYDLKIFQTTTGEIELQFPAGTRFSLGEALDEGTPEYKAVPYQRAGLEKLFNYWLDFPALDRAELLNSEKKPSDPLLRSKYFKNSDTTTSVDILTDIANSDHPLAKLAKKLIPYAKNNNVQVTLIKPGNWPNPKTVAHYNHKNFIEIDEAGAFKSQGSEGSIIHEVIHSITLHALKNNLSVNEEFNKLYQHALKHLNKEDFYALTDLDEFMTGIFTDSKFIEALQLVEPYDNSSIFSSAWDEIFGYILSLLNIKKGSTFYKQAFASAVDVIEYADAYNSHINGYDESFYNTFHPDYLEIGSTLTDELYGDDSVSSSEAEDNQKQSLEAIEDITAEFADKLEIAYSTITEEEAKEITKNAKNPWTNQAGFFFGGKVYFVEGRFTTQTVFHEFSHPFVRALQKTNPKLFKILYSKLSQTETGKRIVQDVTDEHGKDFELFQEEVVVRALEIVNNNEVNDLPQEASFGESVKNILYQIKQFIREIFGKKIKVSQLSSGTSLKTLVDILNGGKKIQIDLDIISQDNTVAYEQNRTVPNAEMEKLLQKGVERFEEFTNRMFDILAKQAELTQTNPRYSELKNTLIDENDLGELQVMKSDIRPFTVTTESKLAKIENIAQFRKNHAHAMVSNLFRLDYVTKKIREDLKRMKQEEESDSLENLQQAYYYEQFLTYWSRYISDFSKHLTKADLENTETKALLNNIEGTIRDSMGDITDHYSEGIRDIIWDELLPMKKKIDDYYNNILKTLKDNNAPVEVYNKHYKDYHGLNLNKDEEAKLEKLLKQKETGILSDNEDIELSDLSIKALSGLKITRERFDKLFRGELGDTNPFSHFFEGYLYSPDLVTGGFALFLKNKLAEVDASYQRDANQMIRELEPLLTKMGFTPSQTYDLLNRIGSVETIRVYNPKTLEMEDKEIRRLLSQFIGFDKALSELENTKNKAEKKYHQDGSDEAFILFRDAYDALTRERIDYMNQEFVPKYYEKDSILRKDDIGRTAATIQRELIHKIRNEQIPLSSQGDYIDAYDKLNVLWREYRLLGDLNTIYGKSKKNIYIDKDGKEHPLTDLSDSNISRLRNEGATIKADLAIAERLSEYRAASREFHIWKERSGVFQSNYVKYRRELYSIRLTPDMPEFKQKLEEWVLKNSRVSINDFFYSERKKIIDRIGEIQDEINSTAMIDPRYDSLIKQIEKSQQALLNVADLYKEKMTLMNPYRDEDNQPIGTQMHKDRIARIKEIELQIIKEKTKVLKPKGSTGEVQKELDYLLKIPVGIRSHLEKARIQDLFDNMKLLAVSDTLIKELQLKFEELNDMQEKEATQYYVDIVNSQLQFLDNTVKNEYIGPEPLTTFTAGLLLNNDIILDLTSQSAEFSEWFYANHYEKESFDPVEKVNYKVWTRVDVWSTIKPIGEIYYNKTQLKDEDGKNVGDPIMRIPSNNYFSRKVKPEYKTEKIVGVTVDNRGQFLPRMDVANKKYINEKYDQLRTSDPDAFKLLQEVTRWWLKIQEGAPRSSKMYLDLPRYRANPLEILQLKQSKQIIKGIFGIDRKSLLQKLITNLKGIIYRGRDAPQSGFNWADESGFSWADNIMLARANMLDKELVSIPISGLYNLDIDETSPNILEGMLTYMGAVKRQKKLLEIHPVAQAIQRALPDSVLSNKLNKVSFLEKAVKTFIPEEGKSWRKKGITNLIKREFEGEQNADFLGKNTAITRISQFMFKRSSTALFALNIPSALKNAIGPKWQAMMLVAAGEHINLDGARKGSTWSLKTMGDLSFSVYDRKNKSLAIQIMELHDPARGRLDAKLPKYLTRTIAEDLANFTWLYNFRKWTETESTLSLFGGIAYTKKVKQWNEEIDYMDIWELRDGYLEIKAGIDPEYSQHDYNYTVKDGDTLESIATKHNITPEQVKERIKKIKIETGKVLPLGTSKEFKGMVNTTNTVINNMAGAYAKFDQPELQRYLAFRFVSFLRRYFTTMAMTRWGVLRPSPGMGEPTEGFYITVLGLAARLFTLHPSWMAHLTPKEVIATKKFLMEIGALLVLMLFILPWIGWDEDDPEKYEKMRERSGAAPFLGLTEPDPDHPFALGGFIHNQMIMLGLQVQAENAAWLPLPQKAFGLDDYLALTSPKAIATGPTIDTYGKMFTLAYDQATGDPNAYYKRNVGPYKWQQKGGSKLVTQFMKSIGLTGTGISPDIAAKNFMGIQARGPR